MRLGPVILFVFYFASFNTVSQNGIVKHFGVEEGLASNRVYTAFQDSKGFIWLATTNGVSRFDGKTFKNYTSNNGLPDNDIFDINEDAVGRIWLSCYNGIPCYISHNRVFTSTDDPLLKKLPQEGYFRFSRLGTKLILTKSSSNTSFEIDEHGTVKHTSLEGVYFIGFQKNLVSVSQSREVGFARYYLLDNTYKKTDSLFFPENTPLNMNIGLIEDSYVAGENKLILHSNQGYCLSYEIRNNQFVHVATVKPGFDFTAVYHDHGRLWVNSPNEGIIAVNDQLLKDDSRGVSFAQQTIQNFMVDREGNLWGCSSGKGLYMIPNNGFSYYDAGNTPEQNDILKLTSFENDIYLGYSKSIFLFPKENKTSQKAPALLHALEDRLVDMYADTSQLVAATTEGILVIDKKSGRTKKAVFHNIKCMHKGPDQSILFGTHSGCFQFVFPDKLSTVFNNRTVAVYPRKNGEVLVGTLNGLFVSKKNKHDKWQFQPVASPELLKKIRISCISELDSVLVIGTVQNGLLLIQGKDYELVKLGPGLNNINCKNIYIDAHKNIWLASFSGLFKITTGKDIHHYSVENIRKFNGLLSDDVNDVLVMNGTAYVAGSNGLSIFSVTKKTDSKKSGPMLHLNELLVNGQAHSFTSNEIHLPADSNSLDLHFSAIDFKSLGHILFKYRLAPLQKNWQFSFDNFSRFEALPPGTYKLEVMAMNAENNWTDLPLTLNIVIKPAWWQSIWFYIFLILVGATAIYLIVRRNFIKKHKTHMRENSLKRHMAELELRALKAQINPHFIFNTLNAIQYFIGNNENEKAENYLNSLADLLRKTLDFSDKSTVPLHAEMDYLENYLELEKLRFDEKFVYTITSDIQLNDLKIEIPPMVLQPHIENALRHGFKNRQNILKKLDIRFSLQNRQLVCEVLDNGIGRAASEQQEKNKIHYRSRGMELSHSKLLVYESITGKTIKTEIEDNYSEDKKIATGTLIRIIITQ